MGKAGSPAPAVVPPLLAPLGPLLRLSPSVPVCVSAPPSPLASTLREQQNMAEPLLEKTNLVPSPCCSSLSPAVSVVTFPEVTLCPLCHSPEADRTEATGVLLITQRPWFSLVCTSQSRWLVETSSLCPGPERDDQSRPEKDRLPQTSLPCPPGAPRVWTGRKPSLCPRAWALLHCSTQPGSSTSRGGYGPPASLVRGPPLSTSCYSFPDDH